MNEKIKIINDLKKIGEISLFIAIVFFVISLFFIFIIDIAGKVTGLFWIVFEVFFIIAVGVSIVRGVMEKNLNNSAL